MPLPLGIKAMLSLSIFNSSHLKTICMVKDWFQFLLAKITNYQKSALYFMVWGFLNFDITDIFKVILWRKELLSQFLRCLEVYQWHPFRTWQSKIFLYNAKCLIKRKLFLRRNKQTNKQRPSSLENKKQTKI